MRVMTFLVGVLKSASSIKMRIAGYRAVALPQFITVNVVIGDEVQGVAHRRQIAGVGAKGTGTDIY